MLNVRCVGLRPEEFFIGEEHAPDEAAARVLRRQLAAAGLACRVTYV